jgi:hypothetical protein
MQKFAANKLWNADDFKPTDQLIRSQNEFVSMTYQYFEKKLVIYHLIGKVYTIV